MYKHETVYNLLHRISGVIEHGYEFAVEADLGLYQRGIEQDGKHRYQQRQRKKCY